MILGKREKERLEAKKDKEEPTVIEVKNVTKKYGKVVAVDNISFKI